MTTDARLLQLFSGDNIFIATATIEAGEMLLIAGRSTPVPVSVPLGHKVAARFIAAGEKVIKYGAPIGSATRDIAAGEHVHTHNIQSDYLPTYLREGQQRYVRDN
jgi:altronate dehydratase small subunit